MPTGRGTGARNLPRSTLKRDNVFGDAGGIYQLATMTGSVPGGYAAGLNVAVYRQRQDHGARLGAMPSQPNAAAHIQDLGAYVTASPSSFHAVHEAADRVPQESSHRESHEQDDADLLETGRRGAEYGSTPGCSATFAAIELAVNAGSHPSAGTTPGTPVERS